MNEIFSDIYGELGRKIQKTETAYQTQIKEMFNTCYERVWKKYLWREAIIFDETVTTTAANEFLYLPKTVDQPLILTDRTNSVIVIPVNIQVLFRRYLDRITDQAFAKRYTHAGEFSVKAQPSVSAKVEVLSSTADTATIRIWGVAGGEVVSELLTLNGTTAVATTASFTQVDRIGKNATTTGTVTVRQQTTNTTLATLAPTEKVVRYIRIRLHDIPSAASTLYLTYKKQFTRLVNDQDIVEIPVLPILKDLTYADLLREQRDFQKASEISQIARADLESFIQEQAMQADEIEQSLPEISRVQDEIPLYQEG